ncbi:MAG: hypothetical protein GY832_41460 [Chloroflexi bacterium]|nr:hypothetical protein [Chloroflexota bacterium]
MMNAPAEITMMRRTMVSVNPAFSMAVVGRIVKSWVCLVEWAQTGLSTGYDVQDWQKRKPPADDAHHPIAITGWHHKMR